MARQAIRHEGDNAEERFRLFVKGSKKSDNAKLGDARVPVKGELRYVEIKECHSNTINQIRAIKFIPLVIYNGQTWIVLPPHEIVRLVTKKSRGQHTEIPFESANLSRNSIPKEFECSDSELNARVQAAIKEGDRNADIAQEMRNLLSQLQKINQETKVRVEKLHKKTLAPKRRHL
ncbi:MAG: hypothetical protein PHV99_02320 [Candidatus Pacebacteria bacterium]|nr:hypothetical protein [Candidatus Paceibacterota bacterium]